MLDMWKPVQDCWGKLLCDLRRSKAHDGANGADRTGMISNWSAGNVQWNVSGSMSDCQLGRGQSQHKLQIDSWQRQAHLWWQGCLRTPGVRSRVMSISIAW